jgi:protein-disulfide isomerase
MRKQHGWLFVLMVVALMVAACGPEMATPTPSETKAVVSPPTARSTEAVVGPPTAAPTVGPLSYADLIDAEDWHVLGSPDAPVTMVEYTDFQ